MAGGALAPAPRASLAAQCLCPPRTLARSGGARAAAGGLWPGKGLGEGEWGGQCARETRTLLPRPLQTPPPRLHHARRNMRLTHTLHAGARHAARAQ